MPLLVDTYNVLHITGILPPEFAGLDVYGLASLVAGSRYGRQPVTLICDGSPKGVPAESADRGDGVRIVYAGPGREADDEITRLINLDSAPKRLTVVSNDNRVKQAARRRRARSMAGETFLRHLALDAAKSPKRRTSARRPPVPLDETQVEAWKRIFGVDDADSPRASDPLAPPPEMPLDEALDPNRLDWLDMNDWLHRGPPSPEE